MNDANPFRAGGNSFIERQGYPRIMFAEPQGAPAPHDWLGKYPMVAFQGSGLHAAEATQSKFPGTPLFRMFTPRVTLETVFASRGSCTQGLGLPFESSAASTGGCDIWAGHFLYTVGSPLSAPMAAGATNITVNDASGFKVGQYLVIHDGGLKDFRNAEHARITAINGNQISLSARYKSTSRSRSAGAWVRQHDAYGGRPTSWTFNMSTQAPKDAKGQILVDYMADWLVANLKNDLNRSAKNISVAGLTFDVDSYIDVFSPQGDTNNDLVPDGGIGPDGSHWWGEGVERFYSRLRQRLPGSLIVGGTQFAYGFETNNGMQIEGFPNGPHHRPVDDYVALNSMMSKYLYNMADHNSYGPRTVQLVMKNGTRAYPTHRVSRFGNAAVRLGLGLAAMDGGAFHHENTAKYFDTWYDEYAVVTNRGASDYGQAVAKGDVAKVRANTGWLGMPKGPFRRVYDEAAFTSDRALLHAGFESGSGGWRANNVSIATSGTAMDGSSGLRISKMSSFKPKPYQASVQSPAINLSQGGDYTITFSARAADHRWITVGLGGYSAEVLVGPKWRRYVLPFKATDASARSVVFGVGRQNIETNIDSVRVFSGDANVYRRDFDRGLVIANATAKPVTVTIGSGYRRIKGSQDPINSGANLGSTVTIAPYDALFALRQ